LIGYNKMKIDEFKNMVGIEDKNTIAIDFDGVIHKNSKGFYDGTLYGELIDGVEGALKQLSNDYTLIVYTCKANPERPLIDGKTGVELIWEWLDKYNLNQYIEDVTYTKPNAKYYIDDKAIKFVDWNQTIKEVV
tara:strand:- start:2951 stop:3352 length:402 start_codon:yes stop_codon:yes gene_type:complete